MSALDFLYVTRRRAIESNMTHEGTLYGVPAWMAVTDEESVSATPKIPILHLWCMAAELWYGSMMPFMPAGQEFEMPIRILRHIGEEEA